MSKMPAPFRLRKNFKQSYLIALFLSRFDCVVRMPEEGRLVKFKNLMKMKKVPYVVDSDFESVMVDGGIKESALTVKYIKGEGNFQNNLS